MPRPARRWLANLGTNRTQLYCSGFNRVARALGVEGVPSFAQLLLADVTIVPEIPEVLGLTADELTAWRPTRPGYRPSTRLVPGGPIYAELDLPLPERVESFLAGGGPVVYVALTSTTADQVRGIVSALRSLGVKLLVAATVHDLADLEGANVMVEGVLPSHLVMPRVDLAVTMGGQGSVQCAMAAGTPLVAVPLHPEQDRLVFMGDYIDRGPDARRVIEQMIAWQAQYPHWVFLTGNHEDMMLDALDNGGRFYDAFYDHPDLWLAAGGRATARGGRAGVSEGFTGTPALAAAASSPPTASTSGRPSPARRRSNRCSSIGATANVPRPSTWLLRVTTLGQR